MKLINKKTVGTLLSLVVCFGLLAQVALATYGLEYATVSGLGTQVVQKTIFAVINVILGFLGIVAIVIILIAGFKWMTAAGNEEKITGARQMLIAGVIGLAIVLASWAIAQFILTSLISATGGQ
jgi:Zn-dependent protease with chaperone function